MATLFAPPQPPDRGISWTTKPRVLEAKFGDGYSQRAGDGLNTMELETTVTWSHLETEEADELIEFFEQQEGYLPFDWTPPGHVQPYRLICTQWTKTPVAYNVVTVRARMKRVFDI